MEEQREKIMEEREGLMVVSSGSCTNLIRRPARFLKPCFLSLGIPAFDLPMSIFRSNHENLRDLGCHVDFAGWKNPFRNWKEWVETMKSLHESTWREAGIHDAIIASTYKIKMDADLILRLAERWCSDTSSFLFPWGEATISLEDAMILGGFSVVGHSVLSLVETEAEEEFNRIDGELNKVREDMNKKKSRRASQHTWMNYMMGRGGDIEHVAFLVLWLSRHVFPCTRDVVGRHFHKMAFRLARGTRLAIAPAVLACIYRDLRLLREHVASYSNERVIEQEEIRLWSLMQLVQIWAWERFPTLRPQPNFIREGEPRMARWKNVKRLTKKNVSLEIDAATANFVWRPYTGSEKFKFYPQNEIWVPVCPGMLEDFVSFAKFVRVSELVGRNCVEPYFPHRVSMQFGLDQDIPGKVARFKESPEIVWKNYNRPIRDEKLYIPSRQFSSSVTSRYSEWWKNSKLMQGNVVKANDTKLLLSPKLKKFKAIVEDNATPMSKKVTAGRNVSTIEGATKASEYKNNIGRDKQVLEKPKIQEYPPGFEPIEISQNMIARSDAVVAVNPVEGRVGIDGDIGSSCSSINKDEVETNARSEDGIGRFSASNQN